MEELSVDSNSPLGTSYVSRLAPDEMTNQTNHISVCICTYKRPRFLKRLLGELAEQETGGRFTYSVVVADNDYLRSAEALVSDFAARSTVPVRYCVEPQQNISLTRNKAIEKATGDFIAFIDDDEFPTKCWLLTLFEACHEYDVDGVLGPVKCHFDEKPPKWVVKGKFYERPTYPTGHIITWTQGRTGNLLLKKAILISDEQPFRPEFLTGEDQDFFRRMIAIGRKFAWCNEALAYEVVPSIRWSRAFMLRKAFFRGTIAPVHPTYGARELVKSVIAVPAYLVALPFALALGHHRFMNLLIKLCDHLGKLLAVAGIRPIKQAYITE
jgi:succinoglycan biosynthesis protein ExoM